MHAHMHVPLLYYFFGRITHNRYFKEKYIVRCIAEHATLAVSALIWPLFLKRAKIDVRKSVGTSRKRLDNNKS